MLAAEHENLNTALEAGRGCTQQGFTFERGGGQEEFLSWDRLRTEAINRAAHLRAIGLKKGDRLAMVVPDAEDFVPTFLGATWAGVIPVPFYAPNSMAHLGAYTDALRAILNNAEPALLATTAKFASMLWDSIRPPLSSLRGVITTEILRSHDQSSSDREAVNLGVNDVVFLQYTSGSTASPKGVEVTHGGLRANAWAIMRDTLKSDSHTDYGVSWLPLNHDMGLVGFVLSPLFHKVQVSFIRPLSFVRNATIWLDTIHRKRATISFAPNFAYALATKRATASQVANWDLSCVKAFGCGGEPINPATMRAFIAKFAPCGLPSQSLLPSFGMAEATLAISFARLEETFSVDLIQRDSYLKERRAKPVSLRAPGCDKALEFVCCGQATPGHEVAVFNDSAERLLDREVGELWVRGPSVARGYYRDPEGSKKTFGGGWLRTGDLGYMVESKIYVTGRMKDLIIINGRNYDPQLIEWLADDVPNVRKGSTTAFSVPGMATEELVVMVESRATDTDALKKLLKLKIAERLQLTASTVIVASPGSLPKTANGKRRRSTARQQYLEQQTLARSHS